jgi:spore coat polysaccharide biosynthesis protein SpsF (cytidylyltransferase family)
MKLGKIGVVVAARMSSMRLPSKALLPLQGVSMVLFPLRRLPVQAIHRKRVDPSAYD